MILCVAFISLRICQGGYQENLNIHSIRQLHRGPSRLHQCPGKVAKHHLRLDVPALFHQLHHVRLHQGRLQHLHLRRPGEIKIRLFSFFGYKTDNFNKMTIFICVWLVSIFYLRLKWSPGPSIVIFHANMCYTNEKKSSYLREIATGLKC